MNKVKKENGVTLVTLVITIAVLIIIAGTVIYRTTNKNGLISDFRNIKDDTDNILIDSEKNINNLREEGTDIDAQIGAQNKQGKNCELKVEKLLTTVASVKLTIKNLAINDENGNARELHKIYYECNLKSSTSAHTQYFGKSDVSLECIFTDLIPNRDYIAIAYGKYKNDSNEEENIELARVEFKTLNLTFSIGDFVDYDAGTWTQAEIDELNSKNLYWADCQTYLDSISDDEIAESQIKNKYSGMAVGSSKNMSMITTKTGFSGYESNESYNTNMSNNVKNELSQGWRILSVDNNVITIVSAGIPEYYLSRAIYTKIGNRIDKAEGYSISNSYVEEEPLRGILNRNFSQYVNSDYANSARMISYDEVEIAKAVRPDLATIGGTYITQTVIYNNHKPEFYTIKGALDSKIYNKSNVKLGFYNTSFNDGCMYSAGALGVRIVVKLKDNISISNTNTIGEKMTGKTYSSPLHLVIN